MQALTRGTFAPDFRLPNVGGGDLSLADVLRRGPVVLAFFKVSCPVCQLALPYVERLHAASAGAASVIGISQNDEKLTRVFMSEYGLSLPVLLDDPRSYPVSNAYQLTNVPTLFYIAPDREIEQTIVGWDRKGMEQIAARLQEVNGAAGVHIFRRGESVPRFKAG